MSSPRSNYATQVWDYAMQVWNRGGVTHQNSRMLNENTQRTPRNFDATRMNALWNLYATNALVQNLEVLGQDGSEQKMCESWPNLRGADLEALIYRYKYLANMCEDKVKLRAYIFYYQKTMAEHMSKKSQMSAPKLEKFCLQKTLLEWKIMSSEERDKLLNEASHHNGCYPLPNIPSRGPLVESEVPERVLYDTFIAAIESAPSTPRVDELSEISLEKLETLVTRHEEILGRLELILNSHTSEESCSWHQKVKLVGSPKNVAPIKICLVGATGAGKSSVINAVLGIPNLVPTSCWAACTAVSIEISFNQEQSPSYRAVVNFIPVHEFERDLEILLRDLRDGSQKSPEAGVAWDKVSAVFPALKKTDIKNITVNKLLKHGNVTNILGRQQAFSAETPQELSDKLGTMIASQKKANQSNSAEHIQPQLWPLVQSVQVFAKADLLQSGVVIVDLPGVHDNNRARTAVAKKYLEDCSNIWVVAPLTRAVDDELARDLLGTTFRRQLRLDGVYRSVSFIGTKADEIGPLHEAANSLGIQTQVTDVTDQLAQAEQRLKDLKIQQSQISDQLDNHEIVHSDILDQLSAYQQAVSQQCDTPDEPASQQGKRKTSPSSMDAYRSMKRRTTNTGFIDQFESYDSIHPDDESQLARADTGSNLTDYREQLSDSIATRKRLLREKSQLKVHIHETSEIIKNLQGEAWRLCVTTRNEASKKKIQDDFVNGQREVDEQIAQDAPDFDLDNDPQDYDSSELSVFCVSARGFLRLNHPSNREKSTDHFMDVDETEIPLLQNHAMHIVQESKRKNFINYINDAERLQNSIRFWASGYARSNNLAVTQSSGNLQWFHSLLRDFKQEVYSKCDTLTDVIENEIQANIFNVLDRNLPKARSSATTTAKSWGLPIREQGLHHMTYKAIVVRDGDFVNRRGIFYSFNDQLNTILTRVITLGWTRTFQTQIPSHIDETKTAISVDLFEFHNAVEHHLNKLGLKPGMMAMLAKQVRRNGEKIENTFQEVFHLINQAQKKANRTFEPSIAKHLQPTYNKAKVQHGEGSFSRMKAIIEHDSGPASGTMYDSAAKAVRQILLAAKETVKSILLAFFERLCDEMKSDYTLALKTSDHKLDKESIRLRQAIIEILESHADAQGAQEVEASMIKKEDLDYGQLTITSS